MKKINSILLAAAAALAFTACSEEPAGSTTPAPSAVVLSGQLETRTLTKDKEYILSGRVVVPAGKTLTIEPGTVIKAEGGREANASVLLVARGGKLIANGTAAEPIIFTSLLDEIESGMTTSPNMDVSLRGLWGGVIILGNAKISAADGDTETQIEGIPPSDQNGLYGGNDDVDNAGASVVNYVSIRHGGTLIGDGNEINGLTLGGVGTATTITNVEVVANLDDGIEWFGGAVNVTNALVWGCGDDLFDIDMSYSGTVTNIVGIGVDVTDHMLEIDGPEGTLVAGFTMTNGTFIGYNEDGTGGGEYADFRDGARGSLSNLYFENFSDNSDFELDDIETSANAIAGDLSFTNMAVNVSHLTSGNTTITSIFKDQSGAATLFTNFDASIVTSRSTGANLGAFAWTSASLSGELN
jgi:hypothetical protein